MATDFDPYAILQVEHTAGQEEIDQAYRRQWAAYPGDPTPDVRLRELQAAYRILSDPAERSAYHARLAERSRDGLMAPPVPATTQPATPTRAPWGGKEILQSIAVIIGAVIIASIPVYFAADAVAGDRPIDEDGNAMAIQFVASAFFQVAALATAWWFAVHKFRLRWDALGLRRPERGLPWLPFTLVASALIMVILYGIFIDAIGAHPDTDLPDAAYDNALPLAIIIVLTVAVAPIIEEIYFRGFVFGGLLGRWGPVWAALASGTLFGAAHLGNPGYFYVIPPIIAIGAMFAWSYWYSKSILPSMAAHFMFNLLQMIAALLAR
jgi:membrane protease YdiL (CAAX protease family)